MSLDIATLRDVAADYALLEVARKAIEDMLVECRDSRMFVLNNNGLVIKERDGSPSSIIRLSSDIAVSIALHAIADHLDDKAAVA